MRKLVFLACMALIATPLGACVTPGATTLPTAAVNAPAQLQFAAELAYNGWGQTAKAIVTNPATSAATKVKVKDIDNRAYAALLQVRLGRATADSVFVILNAGKDLINASR